MKKLLFSAALFAATTMSFAQVGIGTTSPAGALDVVSTTSGIIHPRVASRTAVTTPVNGMTIYDISEKCFKGYADGAWKDMTTCTPVPAAYTLGAVTYQGTSVINTTGIGYNGEAVPAASTITISANVTALAPFGPSTYTVSATDAVTGLVYSATGTFAATGMQTIVLVPNTVVMPALSSGVITMTTTGNYTGTDATLSPRIDVKSIPASATTVTNVTYGTQTWMDRNLGARRVATAIDDVFSYGNHYQWGRPADGHEISVWNGTSLTAGRGLADATTLEALATTDVPGHPNFILTNNVATFYDWRSDNNNNRWQTANQGPCPAGYHVPTDAQWVIADAFADPATSGGATLGWDNNTETFDSALKLPSAGYRNRSNGTHVSQGTFGYYWSSTVGGAYTRLLNFVSTVAYTITNFRAHGFTVRCLKD